MTAKEYLYELTRINRRIDVAHERLLRLRALAEKTTQGVSSGDGFGGGSADRRYDIVAKIVDMERDLNDDIDRYIDKLREASDLIRRVDCAELRIVLESRYFSGESWAMIADRMGYSVRHVLRKHGQALVALEAIMQQNSEIKAS